MGDIYDNAPDEWEERHSGEVKATKPRKSKKKTPPPRAMTSGEQREQMTESTTQVIKRVCSGVEGGLFRQIKLAERVSELEAKLAESEEARDAALAFAKAECDSNDQLRAQLAAAERERDAMKQLIAMQDVWEGEAIHDITALVTERKELRTRAERAEAEAEIVRRARRNGNVLVEVSRKLLELGEFTTNPLYVMLTDNEDGTHMLTFRALSTGHQGGA